MLKLWITFKMLRLWLAFGLLCGQLCLFACIPYQSAPSTKTEFSKKYTGEPIAAVKKFIEDNQIQTTGKGWRTTLPKPPKVKFESKKTYHWHLKTNKGTIKIQLMPSIAPMHVSSTIYLTQLGFYDSLTFHRVINGFMAQGGDPLGNGRGNPGYQYEGEFSSTVSHNRPGLLSMANAGPGTDGSQFFLTFQPVSWLDGKHTIFGEVKEGLEVLKAIEALGSESGATSEKIFIEKATILSN